MKTFPKLFLHQGDPAIGPGDSYAKLGAVSPPRGESPKPQVLQGAFSPWSSSQNF